MTEYGKIPPGYAPDWLLIEEFRAHLFGALAYQHEDDLQGQWEVATERTITSVQVTFYRISEGEMIAVDREPWERVRERLARLRFIWDEPGVFSERLYVRNWALLRVDYHDTPTLEEQAAGIEWLDEALAERKRKGGKPNDSNAWLAALYKLYPSGKPRSKSWQEVAYEIEIALKLVKGSIRSESLQEAVRRKARAAEKALMGYMG